MDARTAGSPKRKEPELGGPGKREAGEGQDRRRPPPFPQGMGSSSSGVAPVAAGAATAIAHGGAEAVRQDQEEKVRRVAGLDVVDTEVLPDEKYEWDQVSQEELDEAKWKELGLQDDYETYEPKVATRSKARRLQTH